MIFASTNNQPSMAGEFFARREELLTNPPPQGVAPKQVDSLSSRLNRTLIELRDAGQPKYSAPITQDLTVTAVINVGSRGVPPADSWG